MIIYTKKGVGQLPYTLEVHHKPVHDTESPRLTEDSFVYICSLFGGGDSQGLSNMSCTLCRIQGQR